MADLGRRLLKGERQIFGNHTAESRYLTINEISWMMSRIIKTGDVGAWWFRGEAV